MAEHVSVSGLDIRQASIFLSAGEIRRNVKLTTVLYPMMRIIMHETVCAVCIIHTPPSYGLGHNSNLFSDRILEINEKLQNSRWINKLI
jgi:hypothetical protein